jgi:exodeoxyribonuclease VII large subunit
MPKLTSQWEFGELFAAPALRRVLSVSELTTSIKRLLEQQVGCVWVKGEVSNLRLQSSGHLYFCLKDATAQLNCVLFRGEARAFNRDLLRDGAGVSLNGELTVYEARGQYQLIVAAVELQGVGALQMAFEKLKQKLQAEGLFAPERKRPLPRYPQRIGVVTSPNGAAIRDVLQALQRRYGGIELVLASCRVQGQGAGEEIARAIRLLSEWHQTRLQYPARRLDLILVTRGGGSLEDLWAFNEEPVARAIFDAAVPVLSAVGHEIDFTMSDFVADLRAATPTAAAEIITEGYVSSRQFVLSSAELLRQRARAQVEARARELLRTVQQLQRQHPRRWLQEQWQRLDDLQGSLQRCVRYNFRAQQSVSQGLSQRLWRSKPSQAVARRREAMHALQRRLREQTRLQIQASQQQLKAAASKLRLLSPWNVLERGYSITMDAVTGRVLQSPHEVQPGQRLRTRLHGGDVESTVDPDAAKHP